MESENKLTQEHRELLTYIEQYWYINGRFPTLAALNNWGKLYELPPVAIERMLGEVSPYLERRGIIVHDYVEILSEEQLAAANLILNLTDRRSIPAKLKALGIDPTRWDGWNKQEAFRRYMTIRSAELLDSNRHEAHIGLMRGVEKSEVGALRLFYELTGQLGRNEANQQVENLRVVLSRFFEILNSEIKDKEILSRISDKFEAVLESQTAAGRVIESAKPNLDEINTAVAVHSGNGLPKNVVSVGKVIEDSGKKVSQGIFDL